MRSPAQRAQKLQYQRTRIATIRRSITNLATAASEQLTNKNFEQLFADECRKLRAPELKLEFIGRQGQAERRRTLPKDYSPSSVFSEGEQKVLALADFIAEARMSDASVPVVFDDPVSSLDHRRVNEVAECIADLVSDHQVVVFTHNIFFATCLQERLEGAQNCAYYLITDEDGKGTVTFGTRLEDTVNTLAKKVNVSIGEAKKVKGEARERQIRYTYSLIRAWCEVFIERGVLAGVTKRYQPNVSMTLLREIKISMLEETFGTVLTVFEDACRYTEAHSQPSPTLEVAPSFAKLEEDWAKLKECRSSYNKAES